MPRDSKSSAPGLAGGRGLVLAAGRGLVLAAALVLSGTPAWGQGGGSVYNVTLGSPRHTISHTRGGVIWQPLSRPGHRMTGNEIAKLGNPHAAFLHWEHHGGWRFDMGNFESDVLLYNFEHYDSLEELYGYYDKPNVVWVLPVGLGATVFGTTYPWLTPEYSAAFVQYVTGTPDPVPTYPSWPSSGTTRAGGPAYDYYASPAAATYNWANLRALRGRTAPWPFTHVIAGTEPFGSENLADADGSLYTAKFTRFFDELERRMGTPLPFRISVFIGLENLYVKTVDKIYPAFKPYAQRNNGGLVINNRFDPGVGSNPDLVQILYRNSTRVGGATAWWYPQAGLAGPERKFHGPEYAAAAVDAKGLPAYLKDHIYWASWAISNMGGDNTVKTMLHRAVNYGLAIAGNALPTHSGPNAGAHVNYSSPWTWAAIWDGRAFVSLQKDHVSVLRTPSFFVHQMFGDGFSGNQLMNFTLTGGNKVNMAPKDANFEAYELQTWITKKPNGDLDLWVVNSSDVNTHTVTGLEAYGVTRWERLKGSSYLEVNSVTNPQVVNQVITQSSLTFAPLSVNRVTLSLGAPGGVRYWGDVTRDGIVNSADALGTLSYSAGLPNPNHDFSVADVSADGQITTLDALIDLYYSVGLDVSGYRVGQPVTGATGALAAPPLSARAPLPAGALAPLPAAARVRMGLRASAPAGPAGPGTPAELRFVLSAARDGLDEELGSFRVRVKWDAQLLRFRSAAYPGDDRQVLLGINDQEAGSGTLTVAAATTGALGVDLLELAFERGGPTVEGSAPRLELEVLDLGAAGSGRDLTPAVEIVAQKVAEDAGRGGGAGEGALGLPYPNPSPGRVRIPLQIGPEGGIALAGGAAEVELSVYDLRGRRVKRLLEGEVVSGERTVEWDGTDQGGRRVPAGIYVVELKAERERRVRKVVIF
jgi:hypothetical protein